MNALLSHVWGDSPAQDRVWQHVTGLAPKIAVAKPLMVLQAFLDDSYDQDGVFVLAGYVASAATWAAFAGVWEYTLPWGLRDERGYYFHMNEMAQTPERMERVGAFYRVIEEHDLTAISMKITIPALRRATQRLWVRGHRINFGPLQHPHVIAFYCLMQGFYENRAQMSEYIGLDEQVDFILDEHCQSKYMLGLWDSYIRSKPENVDMPIGRMPRFENDRQFLPLQSADLFAWWMRKWYSEGRVSNNRFEPTTRWFASLKPQRVITIDYDEDQIATTLRRSVILPEGQDLVVYDDKYPGGFKF